jgi:integrase
VGGEPVIKARKTKSGMRYDVRIRRPDGTVYNRTFKTKKEAERFERAEIAARDRGSWIDPTLASRRLAEVAGDWLESNPGKRESTYERDEIALRVHVIPSIGDSPIGAITPADIQQLVNKWSTTMAPRSTRRNYGVLRAVLAMAVERDLIARSPCRGIKLPKVTKTKRRLPTTDQIAELAAAIGRDYGAMVWIGAMLGLRWGEVAGLRVGSFDLLRRTMTVSEQISRGKGGRRLVAEPKSDAGHRTLTIPESLVGLLATHLDRRDLTGADDDAYVFVSPKGQPLYYTSWRRRVWQPACESVGLVDLGFHDLRRLNASLLVASGVDVRTAQSRLGHSDPRLTLDIYAQTLGDSDKAAADSIGQVFEAKKDETETGGDEQAG